MARLQPAAMRDPSSKTATAMAGAAIGSGIELRLDALLAPYHCSDQPGLVVAVAISGKPIYRRGFGLASIEHGAINTPATRMRIGSVSKQFTCLGALLLAEEGRLDLDAPATDVLPELPSLRGVPTLRQFMTHTSGYRCHIDLGMAVNGQTVLPVGEALRTVLRQTDVNFAPGEGQLYCNSGYHLLSIAIERASGIPFEAFMTERIFAPLGMSNTEFVPSDLAIVPGIATMHVPVSTGGWRRGIFCSEEIRGEGGMVSTLDDMLRWMTHLRGFKVVGTEATWRQMTETAVLNSGFETTYALGLFRHQFRGIEVLRHGGSVLGGSCAMVTVPSHELDIVMMANGGPANLRELQFKVIEAVRGETLAAESPLASAGAFRHLEGQSYLNEHGVTFRFQAVGDTLGISLLGMPPIPLRLHGNDELRIDFEQFALGPLTWLTRDVAPDPLGRAPETIVMSETGRALTYCRLSSPSPSVATVLAPLVGRYHSRDLAADAEISLDRGVATLETVTAFARKRHPLSVLSESVLLAELADLAGSSAVLSFSIDGFTLTTDRSRRVRFDKVGEGTSKG